MNRRIVYMAHPVQGDPANLDRAERWLRWLIKNFQELDFVAPWIYYFRALDDKLPEDRARGLAFDAEMIGRCDSFIMVGGGISTGVGAEMEVAFSGLKPVIDLNALGPEPPDSVAPSMGAWLYEASEAIETPKHFIWRV